MCTHEALIDGRSRGLQRILHPHLAFAQLDLGGLAHQFGQTFVPLLALAIAVGGGTLPLEGHNASLKRV